MSRFLDPLRAEQLDATRWITLTLLRYESDLLSDTVEIPARFVTDFASVPRWLPLTWYLTGNTAHRPSVIHDWLYQRHVAERIERALAAAVFCEAMSADDIEPVPRWQRSLIWAGVRAGGWVAWQNHERRAAALNPKWTVAGWPA
mgnify:CR=1 FL=1